MNPYDNSGTTAFYRLTHYFLCELLVPLALDALSNTPILQLLL